MTLEDYLKNNTQTFGEHRLKATVNTDGTVELYIHPYGKDGDTVDYTVNDSNLTEKPRG